MTADTDEESLQELVNILRKYLTNKDLQTVLELTTAISTAPPDDKYTTVLSVADNQKRTAFHHAAVKGDAKVCAGILDSIAEEQKYRLLQLQDGSGETAISLAAYYGHDGIVKALLEKAQQNFRYDLLKVQNYAGQTALHTAACKGQGKVIRCIADCLTENLCYMLLTIQDFKGNTAIALAAYFGHAKTVCSILDAVNPDMRYEILLWKNSDGQSPLHKAANNGHTDALKHILTSLKKMQMWEQLMLQDNYGNTPIALAAYHDHTLTVQLILHSVEPGRRYEMICVLNKAGQSILHIAAGKGDMETLRSIKDVLSPQQLLDLLMQKDENGNTVVACAVLNSRREAVQWVLERETAIDMLKIWNTKGQSVLHKVAYEGNAIGLRSIIDSVMDYQRSFLLMQKDSSGNTVIACAAHNGHIETVKYILSSAVDVSLRHSMLEVQNLMGQSTLHRAAYNGHTEIVKASMSSVTKEQKYKLLLQKDNQGYIPLALAAHRGHVNILKAIISSIGGDQKYNLLSQRNEDGKTAIALAAYRGHSEAVRYMLSITADSYRKYQMLEDCNVNGLSILHRAALSGSTDILRAITNSVPAEQVHKLLMLQTSNGDTALAFAADEGHSETAKLILLCIIDPAEKCDMLYVQNSDGLSAVHRAAENGHTHVLEVLMNALSRKERYAMLTQLDYAGYDAIHLAECGSHAETAEYLHTVLEQTHYRRCTSEEGRNDLLSIDCIASNAAEEMEGERQVSPIPGTHRENSRDEQTNLRCRITELEEQNRDLTELVQQLRGLLKEKENKIERQPAVTKELKDEATQVDETTDVMTDHREEDTELEEKIERMADRISALEMLNKGLRKANNDRFDRITELEKLINDTLFDDTDKVEDVNITRDESCIEEEAADNELEVDASSCPLQSSSGGVTATTSDTEKVNSTLEDQEYYAIPLPLIRKLRRLRSELQIQDCRVHQNSHEWKNIVIYGTNANTKLLRHLDEFLKENPEFENFEVKVHDRTEENQSDQLSFTFHSKTEAAKSATCELVVQEAKSYSLLFAVGPAHMLFCEEANESLKTEKCNIKKIRDHIRNGNPARKVKIHSGDVEIPVSKTPYISYRYKYKGIAQGHKLYTNDCALFECIPSTVEQVKVGLSTAPWLNKELHVLQTSLQTVHSNRQEIVIKTFCGKLRNDVDIEEDIENHKGIHLTFALESKSGADGAYDKLEPGDSGSILYYVYKKPDNTAILKPWGMLIACDYTPCFALYHAIVLHQALADIVGDYSSLSPLRLYQPSVHGGAVANEVQTGLGGPRQEGPRPGGQQAPVTPSLISTNNISLA